MIYITTQQHGSAPWTTTAPPTRTRRSDMEEMERDRVLSERFFDAGFRAGLRAAAEIVKTCDPPKAPGKMGPRIEIGRDARDAYAGAILAEADK